MTIDLRYDNLNDVFFGFFVDAADGKTAMTALTITNSDVRIKKNGVSTFADKHSGGASYISVGTYIVRLDSTDCNTYGPMQVMIWPGSALPVKMEFEVLTEDAWCRKYTTGSGTVRANAVQWAGTAVTAYATTSQLTSVQTAADSVLGTLNSVKLMTSYTYSYGALTSQLTSVQTAADSVLGTLNSVKAMTSQTYTYGALTSQLTSVQLVVDAGGAGVTTSQIWEYTDRQLTESVATNVWAVGTRALTDSVARASQLTSVQLVVDAGGAGVTTSQIWEYTNRTLTESVAVNVWAVATRALTDSVARASQLTSVQLVADSTLGTLNSVKAMTSATYSYGALTSQLTSVQLKADSVAVVLGSLYASLAIMSNPAPADVWAVATRALTDSVARTSHLTSVQLVADSVLGTVNSLKIMTSATYSYGALTSQLTSVQLVVDAGGAGVTTSQIWEYSDRQLTESVAVNVWAVTTRALTDSIARTSQLTSVQLTLESVPADVWAVAIRTLTSGGDATLATQSVILAQLYSMAGATFATATDSLEAIRDRGDVAWITGSGLAGANTVTLTIRDGGGLNVVQANVEVYDSLGTTFYEKKISNSSGQAVFKMDDGVYTIVVHKAGYSFSDTTLTVAGATSQTITGTANVVPAPVTPDMCRISIYVKYQDGTIPASVTTALEIIELPYTDSNVAYSRIPFEGVYSATSGLLYFDIKQGAVAVITIEELGMDRIKITIPATATADIEDLI